MSATSRYIPKIREASIPDDGGWAELEDDKVLLLSIPEWEEIVQIEVKEMQFVWMYDHQGDAYLLCFQLNQEVEKAIAFPKEHAGLLLTHENAYQSFSILITADSLASANEDTNTLYFPQIQLKRHPKAGW